MRKASRLKYKEHAEEELALQILAGRSVCMPCLGTGWYIFWTPGVMPEGCSCADCNGTGFVDKNDAIAVGMWTSQERLKAYASHKTYEKYIKA